MSWLCYLVFILLTTFGYCQQPGKSPLFTASSAYASGEEDIRGAGINLASLAYLEETQFVIGSERKFMLNELGFYSAASGFRTRFGNFGVKGDYSGSGRYNESQLGLAYGMKLTENISLGARFNYHALKIAGYGRAATFGTGAGLLIQLQEKLRAGLQIENPFGRRFGKDHEERLLFSCSFGMGYLVSATCFFSAEMMKEEDHPINGRIAVEYRFVPGCRARLGVNTAYSELWTGIGFDRKQSSVEFNISYHAQLGLTPGLVLLFKLKRGKE